MHFGHADPNRRGKSKDIYDLNMDGIENLDLSYSILSSTAKLNVLSNYRFYMTK